MVDVKDLTVDGAYFNSIGDDGYGVFFSHNQLEAEKLLMKIKRESIENITIKEKVNLAITNMRTYSTAVKKQCKEYPYIDIRTIIKELKEIVK